MQIIIIILNNQYFLPFKFLMQHISNKSLSIINQILRLSRRKTNWTISCKMFHKIFKKGETHRERM